MPRVYLLLSIILTACTWTATTTRTPTATGMSNAAASHLTVAPTEAPTPIVMTALAVTASVDTALPITVLPSGQVTPMTHVPVTLSTSTPIPTLSGEIGFTELKYRVLAEFPDFFFCDPDYYPVARQDETEAAQQRFPEIQANSEAFNAILDHNNLNGLQDFTDEQILLIYRDYKKLNAIHFDASEADYLFQIQVAESEGQGETITGRIDRQGIITIQQRQPTIVTCPICLAAESLIDAPDGPLPVQDLRVGMLVWTVDKSGSRVAMPVRQVGHTVVPTTHHIVDLELSDGRELYVSPGHPTADGRTVGQLRIGDILDGAVIVSAERTPYLGYATYDVLPAGDTGFYWANGVLIASTFASTR